MTRRKRVLITGGTDGIGFQVARLLAQSGHHLILLSRNMQKGQAVRETLVNDSGNDEIEIIRCDLSSLDDIRTVADAFLSRNRELDVLVNCAGVYLSERTESVDGHEMHLAVNYLSGFLLSRLLLPTMNHDRPARIIIVSGETARFGRIHFPDLNYRSGFSTLRAYAQSKLANIMFSFSLAERLQGTTISCVSMHPGPAATSHLSGGPAWLSWFWSNLTPGPEKAARRVAYVAMKARVNPGDKAYFFGRWKFWAPFPAYRKPKRDRLWQLSSEWTRTRDDGPAEA